MRRDLGILSWLAVLAIAGPAFADDADPTAPPRALTLSGSATLTSDYRFRGISQTGGRPALQGSLDLDHSSGFYLGAWASTIHNYAAHGADAEVDLYGGYRKMISGTTVDGGLLYYYYPGAGDARTDFFEPYLNVSHMVGPISAKVGLNYAWKQHALACAYDIRCGGGRRADNLYTYGELSAGLPGTPLTLTAHAGESWGRSSLTAGLKDYADWSLTAAYRWNRLTFSIAYADTDLRKGEIAVNGRDEATAGLVAAVAVTF